MCHPLFCIEIFEVYITLRVHSFWYRQVLDMTPGYVSISLSGVLLLLGMLPILSGCLDPWMLRTTARPILTSYVPSSLICQFFSHSYSREGGGGYILPILWILPSLLIFSFRVEVFLP